MRYLLKWLTSGRLAIILILCLLVLSVAGTVIPQQGQMPRGDIAAWQSENPGVTRIAETFGFFSIFTSSLFITVVVLLGINTAACTIRRFSSGSVTRYKRFDTYGSIALHLGIIVTLAGGAISALYKFDGEVILTEGQAFRGEIGSFFQYTHGKLFTDQKHAPIEFTLRKVARARGDKPTESWPATILEMKDSEGLRVDTLRVNCPVTVGGYDITQDKLGYSPLVSITDLATRRVFFSSYIALQNTGEDAGRKHSDFIVLGDGTHRLKFALLGQDRGDGIEFGESSLEVDMLSPDGTSVSETVQLDTGKSVVIRQFLLKYEDLRRWSSFRVVHDPGYIVVCIGLWLGLAGLIARYAGELYLWFSSGQEVE